MNEPLTPERAAEIRDRADRRMEKCRRRGQVSLADLECAKNEVHDLADEIDRLRAERDRYAHQLDGMCLAQWEDAQEAAESDTLPAWLYQRFMPDGTGWDNLDDDQRSYWEHQARAVRRAVARNGFKAEGGA